MQDERLVFRKAVLSMIVTACSFLKCLSDKFLFGRYNITLRIVIVDYAPFIFLAALTRFSVLRRTSISDTIKHYFQVLIVCYAVELTH